MAGMTVHEQIQAYRQLSSAVRLARYRELRSQLDALIAQGQGDSEAADAVRDALDPYWYALTAEEEEEVRA
jgi:hypothetical protein